MSDEFEKASAEREEVFVQQLADVENTQAHLAAQYSVLRSKAKDVDDSYKEFAAEAKRLKTMIGKEIASRYQAADRQVSENSQQFSEAIKKKATNAKKPVSVVGIEALKEKLGKKTKLAPALTPPGMPKPKQAQDDPELVKMIAEMTSRVDRLHGVVKKSFDMNAKRKPPGPSRGRGQ